MTDLNQRPPAVRPDWTRHAGSGVSLWTPPYWARLEADGFALVVLGPDEPYRANATVALQPLQAPVSLDAAVQAAADSQRGALADFLEYDRRQITLGGVPAVERQYAWFEQPPGVVLYQHQVAAILGATIGTSSSGSGSAGTLLQVHLTSDAPSYFRFAAIFRRIVESLGFESR
jgi:hypothetical protein